MLLHHHVFFLAILSILIQISTGDQEVIMRDKDRLPPRSGILAHGKMCKLVLTNFGNLVALKKNRFNNWQVIWSSGSQGPAGEYFALMRGKSGKLVVCQHQSRGVWVDVYSTTVINPSLSGDDDVISHELKFDEDCRLTMYRKKQDEEEEVWTNHKKDHFPIEKNEILQKGDLFTKSHYTLLLQHDCNLVQYVGEGQPTRGADVWTSKTSNAASSCYLYIDKYEAVLCKGFYDERMPKCYGSSNRLWNTSLVQRIVVPNEVTRLEANDGSLVPFGIDAFPQEESPKPMRYQQVYHRSEFDELPSSRYITHIAFRPDDDEIVVPFYNKTQPHVKINLSITNKNPDGLKPKLEKNVGQYETVVLDGSLSLSSAVTSSTEPRRPKDFDIVIELTTPFLYDPKWGKNLLMDVTNFEGGENVAVFDATFDPKDSVSRVASRSFFVDGVDYVVKNEPDTHGLVTEFGFVQFFWKEGDVSVFLKPEGGIGWREA